MLITRALRVLFFAAAAALLCGVSCEGEPAQETPPPGEEDTTPLPEGPAGIFAALRGKPAKTGGWADAANEGAGLTYTNPADFILIDDASFPDPVEKRTAFTNAINSKDEAFIILSGLIDLSDGKISDSDHGYFDQFDSSGNRTNRDITFKIENNKTIIGVDSARVAFGGLRISGRQNIIIRNIAFWDAHGSTEKDTSLAGNADSKASIDALVVEEGADIIPSGIWIDHCAFSDGTCNDMIRNFHHDGSFDIRDAHFLTVSWCEFYNHDKVMLVGSSDSSPYLTPEGRQITLHHNYFHHTTQRTPRTRGTQMHIYNNYWKNTGVVGNSGYCMGPGRNAQFIVENNFFDTGTFQPTTKVIDFYDAASYPALVFQADNNVTFAYSNYDSTAHAKPWTPPYPYTLDEAAALPESIPAGAGNVLEWD
ncbi:MAG: hypothetical protein LBR16_05745 [Treponema sp.]|jgi:pectate lyase|nr:hypothetical protein [Treponema sp.]